MSKALLKDDYNMVVMNENPTCLNSMENDISWIDRALNGDGNEDFYGDFPPIPDFSCMSSSSSSSSSSRPPAAYPLPTVPPAYKLVPTLSSCSSVSSSSAASLAVLRTDVDEETEKNQYFHYQHQQVDVPPPVPPIELSTTGSRECTDVMEDFGFMDLIDDDYNDIWDTLIFQNDENFQVYQEQQNMAMEVGLEQDHHQNQQLDDKESNNNGGLNFLQGKSELVMIFFEWLKEKKDHISAEDMRSIKLSRSTAEIASKRLGTTDEGKKQLLKFILVWVDQYHLHRKRTGDSIPPPDYFNPSFSPSPWMGPPLTPPYGAESGAIIGPAPGVFSPGNGYVVDPYNSNGAIYPPSNQPINYGNPNLINPEFEAMDSTQSWQQSQLPMRSQSLSLPNNISFSTAAPPPPPVPFPDNGNFSTVAPPPQAVYGSQYPYEVFDKNSERLVRFDPAATKEARKKRMARQRRVSSHRSRHHSSTNQTDENKIDDDELIMMDGDSSISTPTPSDPGEWVYWSPTTAPPASFMAMAPPLEASQPVPMAMPPNYQLQAPSNQQQGWQTDNNFTFLLQKVLKASDVNNLGRIVLPKKEVEIYLPKLDSRDGITLALEEFGSSKVWYMRYRFWPNNKSRMYVLENAGEFVRVHGLQEGDLIMMYVDLRCGRYLIRSVKVREVGQKKVERKKPTAKRKRNIAADK